MVLRYDKILKFQFFIIIKFAKSLFYFSATILCFISRWTIVSLPAQAALPALVLMSQRMRKKKQIQLVVRDGSGSVTKSRE